METIFAQATAPGKAGISVIRISGPEAFEGCARFCGRLPEPRRAGLRKIRRPDGSEIDEGIVLCFPEGGSFTGEPVVELHLHGSVAVVQAVLGELSRVANFRPALPGEFTRRALDNRRLDLTQVEGLADLIDAETELQRQQAQAVLTGALSRKVDHWRRLIVETMAMLEITLDFSDEDVPSDTFKDARERIVELVQDLENEVASSAAGERIRDGFEVAIMGAPNAGKSTLLNAIARRSVALTSEIAGTTRDVLEVRLDLRGLPVTFLDTAGLRETADPLERAGIDIARTRSDAADLRIWLDMGGAVRPPNCDLVVRAKDDSGARSGVSGLTGKGVPQLLEAVEGLLKVRIPQNRLAVRERHRVAMVEGIERLRRSLGMIEEGFGAELVSEELRAANSALLEIVGGVDVEDLLNDIFASFCIGK